MHKVRSRHFAENRGHNLDNQNEGPEKRLLSLLAANSQRRQRKGEKKRTNYVHIVVLLHPFVETAYFNTPRDVCTAKGVLPRPDQPRHHFLSCPTLDSFVISSDTDADARFGVGLGAEVQLQRRRGFSWSTHCMRVWNTHRHGKRASVGAWNTKREGTPTKTPQTVTTQGQAD